MPVNLGDADRLSERTHPRPAQVRQSELRDQPMMPVAVFEMKEPVGGGVRRLGRGLNPTQLRKDEVGQRRRDQAVLRGFLRAQPRQRRHRQAYAQFTADLPLFVRGDNSPQLLDSLDRALVFPRHDVRSRPALGVGQDDAVHLTAGDESGRVRRVAEQVADQLPDGYQYCGWVEFVMARGQTGNGFRARYASDIGGRSPFRVKDGSFERCRAEVEADEAHGISFVGRSTWSRPRTYRPGLRCRSTAGKTLTRRYTAGSRSSAKCAWPNRPG